MKLASTPLYAGLNKGDIYEHAGIYHINVATPLLCILNPYTSNLNKADCMGQGIVMNIL